MWKSMLSSKLSSSTPDSGFWFLTMMDEVLIGYCGSDRSESIVMFVETWARAPRRCTLLALVSRRVSSPSNVMKNLTLHKMPYFLWRSDLPSKFQANFKAQYCSVASIQYIIILASDSDLSGLAYRVTKRPKLRWTIQSFKKRLAWFGIKLFRN